MTCLSELPLKFNCLSFWTFLPPALKLFFTLCSFSNQRPCGNTWLCKRFTPFDGYTRSFLVRLFGCRSQGWYIFWTFLQCPSRGLHVEGSHKCDFQSNHWPSAGKGNVEGTGCPTPRRVNFSVVIIFQNSLSFWLYAYSGIVPVSVASYLSVNVSLLSSSSKACWNTSLVFLIPGEADVVTLYIYSRRVLTESLRVWDVL